MKQLFDFRKGINKKEMQIVINSILHKGVVIFPTETVYGIGANAFDKDAVTKIFKAKNRPADNPLIVHISNYKMLDEIVTNVGEIERKLIDNFWPGPLTIILPKKEIIPSNVSCNLDTIGVRMPSNQIALELIESSGVPIAAPSANISGKPSGTMVEDIIEELKDKVDYIINGGKVEIGLESTVVKVINGAVVILRPGKITPEDIKDLGLKTELDSHIFKEIDSDESVESPGMKHRHYAPKTNTVLVYSKDINQQINKIQELIKKNNDKSVGILGFNEDIDKFSKYKNIAFINIGSRDDMEKISQNIFNDLRKLDELNVDVGIIEGVKKEGLGIAIMNRLTRACEHNVIEV